MKTQLPFRLAILNALNTLGGATVMEIIESLSKDYAGERQLREASVENHLLALRAVGLVEIRDGKQTVYSITPQGKIRLEKSIRR